jgi:hypothetical protein
VHRTEGGSLLLLPTHRSRTERIGSELTVFRLVTGGIALQVRPSGGVDQRTIAARRP